MTKPLRLRRIQRVDDNPVNENTKRNGWLGGENQNLGSLNRQNRWLTPRHLVDPLGTFDLDPAGAPGYELAKRTYQIDDGQDGLVEPWEGRVWLNPPYGNLTKKFMARMAEHNHGTALVFARTETATWHQYIWPYAKAILFLEGRVSFLDPEGNKPKFNSGAPSVLVAYGEKDMKALSKSGINGHLVIL